MCTNIKLTAKNGSVFFGRTMDLSMSMFGEDTGIDLEVKIVSVPKNVIIESQLYPWTSKYAVIGTGTNNTSLLYDGVNEHGLAGDCQVLMETTRSSESEIKKQGKTAVIGEEFVMYVLTNFKSVDEIRAHYSEYVLTDQPYHYKGVDLQFPLHYTFIDETGVGIVLEPVLDGSFKIYDYLEVTTNSPEYDDHQVNIRNYIGVDNVDVTEKTLTKNVTLKPIENGTGYGLFGIPGDYTSPSRFVRAFYFKHMLDAFDADKGMNNLYSVFRSVIIPRGLEHGKKGESMTDYTRYWSGYDLSQRSVVVQTGEGLAFTSKKLLQEGTKITYEDISLADHLYIS